MHATDEPLLPGPGLRLRATRVAVRIHPAYLLHRGEGVDRMRGRAAVMVNPHPHPVSRILTSTDCHHLPSVDEVPGAINRIGDPIPGQLGVGQVGGELPPVFRRLSIMV